MRDGGRGKSQRAAAHSLAVGPPARLRRAWRRRGHAAARLFPRPASLSPPRPPALPPPTSRFNQAHEPDTAEGREDVSTHVSATVGAVHRVCTSCRARRGLASAAGSLDRLRIQLSSHRGLCAPRGAEWVAARAAGTRFAACVRDVGHMGSTRRTFEKARRTLICCTACRTEAEKSTARRPQ